MRPPDVTEHDRNNYPCTRMLQNHEGREVLTQPPRHPRDTLATLPRHHRPKLWRQWLPCGFSPQTVRARNVKISMVLCVFRKLGHVSICENVEILGIWCGTFPLNSNNFCDWLTWLPRLRNFEHGWHSWKSWNGHVDPPQETRSRIIILDYL